MVCSPASLSGTYYAAAPCLRDECPGENCWFRAVQHHRLRTPYSREWPYSHKERCRRGSLRRSLRGSDPQFRGRRWRSATASPPEQHHELREEFYVQLVVIFLF